MNDKLTEAGKAVSDRWAQAEDNPKFLVYRVTPAGSVPHHIRHDNVDAAVLLQHLEAGCTVEVVAMTAKEYHEIPGTIEAQEFFGKR